MYLLVKGSSVKPTLWVGDNKVLGYSIWSCQNWRQSESEVISAVLQVKSDLCDVLQTKTYALIADPQTTHLPNPT